MTASPSALRMLRALSSIQPLLDSSLVSLISMKAAMFCAAASVERSPARRRTSHTNSRPQLCAKADASDSFWEADPGGRWEKTLQKSGSMLYRRPSFSFSDSGCAGRPYSSSNLVRCVRARGSAPDEPAEAEAA